ncbi:hypothetical protein HPB49_011973 [Dermacentor silvarum]|uniref:Uncharacterized protein n=1 Tax=Dermacentor silvarum TaxID=543639 RepID=A0ACB8CX94_DERSI|nr:hypothetical protein HPB49_011973 [Dermacentor silvarum]
MLAGNRLETTTGFFLVLATIYFVCLDTVSARIQGRCRPEYRNLPSGVTHTACKGPNPRCTLDRALTGLSPQIKQQALQVHNDYRSQVAQGRLQHYPPAKNMYELVWDDEMAEVAQAFAEQCDYSNHDHREARITSRFKAVGQCFGWAIDSVKQTNTEGKTWADDWFIEYRDYNPNAVASFDTRSARGVVTHFTQRQHRQKAYILAWADLQRVSRGDLLQPSHRPLRSVPPGETGGGGGGGGGSGRTGSDGDAGDDDTMDVGLTIWTAGALFASFLLGACVGFCLVAQCRRRGSDYGGGGALAGPNTGTTSTASAMNTLG